MGRVFCIKLGAEFVSDTEKARFLAHELDHPRITAIAPDISNLADVEGLVESEIIWWPEIRK